MTTNKATTLVAAADSPVVIYYCKAGIQTGRTIRVMQDRVVYETSRVTIAEAWGEMWHDNAKGKPKASGARCVLSLTVGAVTFPSYDTAAAGKGGAQ